MKPERWLQIDAVFQAALERPSAERTAFLNIACGDDESLRREVAALLAADKADESLLEAPAYAVAAPLLAGSAPQELLGKTIGHYQVVALLGRGGMGEVYRARDLKLDRTVALKVLPAEVAADTDRLKRFIREAKAASALNHPNVATIYEIGEAAPEASGANFIVMEYVEGQTLASKINGQPLPISEIVVIATQIADALSEAHRHGITHRDIKPANVMLNERGQVKVLDFGLAKLSRPSTPALTSDISTLTKTVPGLVLGTVPYMSPEQALGKDVDPRSDLFSLGIVIYEMATGRLPFAGANTIETLDRLLHWQPEAMAGFNDEIPPELERLVSKCLEKERAPRYQSAEDLMVDLGNLKRSLESGSSKGVLQTARDAQSRTFVRFFGRRRWALAALCVALALAGIFGILQVWRWGAGGAKPLSSIAVLPLKNLSANPELEWFSDGITESLITEFQKIKALKVIASTSVMPLKTSKQSVPEIAHELGVEAILEGSALRVGDNVRITSRLIEAATARVLWTKDYDREYKDVLTLYREVARTVASEIQVTLSPAEQSTLSQSRTVVPAVQDALLMGRSHLNQIWRDPANISKALTSFEEAARLDPRNAEAQAGISESYALLGNWGMKPQAEVFPKAQAAALRAIELEDGNAAAHRAMIFWHFTWQHDWPQAEHEIKRTLDLAPNDTRALSYYAEWMIAMGRNDEAITLAQRAHELAPLDLGLFLTLGRIYYFARRYDEVIRISQAILEIDENWPNAAGLLTSTYLAMKKYDEAWQWRVKAMNSDRRLSDEDRRRFAEAWRVGGWPAYWREELVWLERARLSLALKSGAKAWLYSQVGERDKAFTELEVAFREHSPWLFQLSDPRFDSLRTDPRFQELRRRLNLPTV